MVSSKYCFGKQKSLCGDEFVVLKEVSETKKILG